MGLPRLLQELAIIHAIGELTRNGTLGTNHAPLKFLQRWLDCRDTAERRWWCWKSLGPASPAERRLWYWKSLGPASPAERRIRARSSNVSHS